MLLWRLLNLLIVMVKQLLLKLLSSKLNVLKLLRQVDLLNIIPPLLDSVFNGKRWSVLNVRSYS